MSDVSDTRMNGIWTMTLWSQAKHFFFFFVLLMSQEFGHFLVYDMIGFQNLQINVKNNHVFRWLSWFSSIYIIILT